MTPNNLRTLKPPPSPPTNSKTVQFTSDSGNSDSDTEKENKTGKTDPSMKDTGETTWHTEKED